MPWSCLRPLQQSREGGNANACFFCFVLHLSCLQFPFIVAIPGQVCVTCTILTRGGMQMHLFAVSTCIPPPPEQKPCEGFAAQQDRQMTCPAWAGGWTGPRPSVSDASGPMGTGRACEGCLRCFAASPAIPRPCPPPAGQPVDGPRSTACVNVRGLLGPLLPHPMGLGGAV